MQAVIFEQHGGPEVLKLTEVADPQIKANEVLVEVRACALNHLDVWVRGGLPGIKIPLPHILGNDVAGVVSQVGELVTWIKAGDDVLVHAAGSGVGSLGIQIAKLRGARVIATASSDEKLAKARELGADETINYSRDDWPKEVKKLTNGRGVDVVFEHTGAATWPGSILSLKKGGRLVTCGATSGFDAHTDLRHVFYRHLTILGSMMGSKADLLAAMKFIESGQIRAVVDRTLPLAEARKAHELLEDRAQFGKLVLSVSEARP